MDDDEELERAMLSITPSKLQVHSSDIPSEGDSSSIKAERPESSDDMTSWSCSQHQKLWMRTELQDLGLWPGSPPVRNPGNAISLPRVIVGTGGQYYIMSSRLCCKACRRFWFADSPRWLEKLPKRFTNLLPAFLTYKKAICKSVMDELRRTGHSPGDMANQVNELMQLKYERAHLAYLHAIESVREAEAGVYGQRTIGRFGTFGQVFRSDHTRKVAQKSESEKSLETMYQGLAKGTATLEWKRQASTGWTGIAEDLKRLQEAYEFCGIHPANPTKQHVRQHCRIKIPQPTELLDRVEKVLKHFHLATDPNNVQLFRPSMLKMWRIQRVHILRGCLNDPELSEGIMYRFGGTLQLNHVPGEGAKVPNWIPVRGTSQQEGYHFHQAKWITGTQVSTELFQAQGMTGVARWNYQRLVDLKQPGVILPAVFDPELVAELNSASNRVTGQEKYPVLHSSHRDTGEKFGL
ncbi:hypothetical protein NHX12_028156, partial [Muraenolepis orangiensis]